MTEKYDPGVYDTPEGQVYRRTAQQCWESSVDPRVPADLRSVYSLLSATFTHLAFMRDSLESTRTQLARAYQRIERLEVTR